MKTPIDKYGLGFLLALLGGVFGGLWGWQDCQDSRGWSCVGISFFIGGLFGVLLRWTIGFVYLIFWPPVSIPEKDPAHASGLARFFGLVFRLVGICCLVVFLHELHWVVNLASLLNVGLEMGGDFHRKEANGLREIISGTAAVAGGGSDSRPKDIFQPNRQRKPSVYSARPFRWLIRDQGQAIDESFSYVKQLTRQSKVDPHLLDTWITYVRKHPLLKEVKPNEVEELSKDPETAGTLYVAFLMMDEMKSVIRRTWVIQRIPSTNQFLLDLEKENPIFQK